MLQTFNPSPLCCRLQPCVGGRVPACPWGWCAFQGQRVSHIVIFPVIYLYIYGEHGCKWALVIGLLVCFGHYSNIIWTLQIQIYKITETFKHWYLIFFKDISKRVIKNISSERSYGVYSIVVFFLIKKSCNFNLGVFIGRFPHFISNLFWLFVRIVSLITPNLGFKIETFAQLYTYSLDFWSYTRFAP